MRTTGFLTVMLMILITMTAKAQVGGFDPENPGDPQVPVLKYNLEEIQNQAALSLIIGRIVSVMLFPLRKIIRL